MDDRLASALVLSNFLFPAGKYLAVGTRIRAGTIVSLTKVMSQEDSPSLEL